MKKKKASPNDLHSPVWMLPLLARLSLRRGNDARSSTLAPLAMQSHDDAAVNRIGQGTCTECATHLLFGEQSGRCHLNSLTRTLCLDSDI